MPKRELIQTDVIYHVFNRSIAGYTIFNKRVDYERFVSLMRYYIISETTSLRFSDFLRTWGDEAKNQIEERYHAQERNIHLLAFCLMPTHFHFVVKQSKEGALSTFMHKLQSSYSHYFNLCHKRQGPLWSSRFKHVECETDEQLLHLTRYVHLNPVTAHLVDNPAEWFATSFREYIRDESKPICNFKKYIPLINIDYEQFVCEYIENQRELDLIKKLMVD